MYILVLLIHIFIIFAQTHKQIYTCTDDTFVNTDTTSCTHINR